MRTQVFCKLSYRHVPLCGNSKRSRLRLSLAVLSNIIFYFVAHGQIIKAQAPLALTCRALVVQRSAQQTIRYIDRIPQIQNT